LGRRVLEGTRRLSGRDGGVGRTHRIIRLGAGHAHGGVVDDHEPGQLGIALGDVEAPRAEPLDEVLELVMGAGGVIERSLALEVALKLPVAVDGPTAVPRQARVSRGVGERPYQGRVDGARPEMVALGGGVTVRFDELGEAVVDVEDAPAVEQARLLGKLEEVRTGAVGLRGVVALGHVREDRDEGNDTAQELKDVEVHGEVGVPDEEGSFEVELDR
jgi:hypothetical protein